SVRLGRPTANNRRPRLIRATATGPRMHADRKRDIPWRFDDHLRIAFRIRFDDHRAAHDFLPRFCTGGRRDDLRREQHGWFLVAGDWRLGAVRVPLPWSVTDLDDAGDERELRICAVTDLRGDFPATRRGEDESARLEAG